jgi:hypothetical protein
VYLVLQSSMVGGEVTRSLLPFQFLVFGSVGAALVLASVGGWVPLEYLQLEWWAGLFVVYLACELMARRKFVSIFSSQRTKRERCWYVVRHAVGVTLFWGLQTFLSLIVVSVEFDPLKRKRWPLVLYAALTLTLLRNLSLNTLGTAFIARLSDHFYLEDAEMMEMRTDQMLLTQLSIISSYSSLWFLFAQTRHTDWPFVLCGIVLYQLILLILDVAASNYIRPKMISLLKGELIAWLAVAARVAMNFVFPAEVIAQPSQWPSYVAEALTARWRQNLKWTAVYGCGVALLLALLWLRVWRLWSYEHVEAYWDFDEFALCSSRSSSARQFADDERKRRANRKQRNRLMLVCALTLGFVVSVTEAVSSLEPWLSV